MTPADIAALRALCDGATRANSAEWYQWAHDMAEREAETRGGMRTGSIGREDNLASVARELLDEAGEQRAIARHVPELLAEITRLHREVEVASNDETIAREVLRAEHLECQRLRAEVGRMRGLVVEACEICDAHDRVNPMTVRTAPPRPPPADTIDTLRARVAELEKERDIAPIPTCARSSHR